MAIEEVGTVLLSMIVGAVVTFLVARHYYEKASNDLKDEAAMLRKMVNFIGASLNDADLARLGFNDSGDIDRITRSRTIRQTAVIVEEEPDRKPQPSTGSTDSKFASDT